MSLQDEGSTDETDLSLSAVKMTLRSSSRDPNTLRSRRRLRQENRHSKSTCSRRESEGRQSSITWEYKIYKIYKTYV